MLITQEHQMTSQPIASTTLLDTVVSPHQNRLPNHPSTDHNIMIPEWQQSTQQITCLLRLMQLLSQTSTHGQEITGKPLTKMLTTPEPPTISQPTASTTLLDTAVLPHLSKLPNHPSTDHNITTQEWQLSTQPTTCLLKEPQHQTQDLSLTYTQV
jgi:hypothetical protein